MKLLWLSHLVPYPPKGGVLQRSYNLIKEVSKQFDVYLLAFIQKDLINTMYASYEEGIIDTKSALSDICKHVEYIPIPSELNPSGKEKLAFKSLFTKLPYTINWLNSKEYSSAIKRLIEVNNFDLIHFDTISLAPYISEFNKTPVILDHHNIESDMMLRRASLEKNIFKKLYYLQEGNKLRRFENEFCPKFDMHITCSRLDSERLQLICPDVSVEVVPNGVDTSYFRPSSRQSVSKSLVFAGGLTWYPNRKAMLFFARKVWPLLKESIPDISIDIIGKGPPDELVQISKSDSSFKVHGFVDDVRPFIDKASIYVCPIDDGGGTKLKILDALAMGKAIVANPIACEGIDVENNKTVKFAVTPEDYVSSISYLLNNKDIIKGIGKSAIKLINDKYSYLEIGNKLSSIYKNLIN